MTDLEQTLSRLRNVHVATLEKNGQVTFLHRIEEGPADKSYGIHVAKIAGLPSDLLKRADTILSQLEGQSHEVSMATPTQQSSPELGEQLSLFAADATHPVLEELKTLDIYNMTPMEVMMAVAEMKKRI